LGQQFDGQVTPHVGVFASVSAGGRATCGLRTDGVTTCWGYEQQGVVDDYLPQLPTA